MSEFAFKSAADAWRRHLTDGGHEPFRQVVELTLPLVRGTALRRCGKRRDLVEDVCQMVFLDLYRRGAAVHCDGLGGWLHKHTWFVAGKMLRGEARRARREARVAAAADGLCEPMTGQRGVDEILFDLGEDERRLVWMRHVEGRSHAEAGRALGISEAAAQKRVERALARLRKGFAVESERGLASLLMVGTPNSAAWSARMAEQATSVGGGATCGAASGLGKTMSSAVWGLVAAVTISAIPLVLAWRDFQKSQLDAAVSMPKQAERVPMRFTPGDGSYPGLPRPLSFRSPDEAVHALLEIADRYGLGSLAADRAVATVWRLPTPWMHDVLVGLGREAPPSVRGSVWYGSVIAALAERWEPRAMPGDLLAILPLMDCPCGLCGLGLLRVVVAAAESDLGAVLEIGNERIPDHQIRTFQRGIMTWLLPNDPAGAIRYYQGIPQISSSSFSTGVEDAISSAISTNPDLVAKLWQALPESGGRHRQRLLGLFSWRGFPGAELRERVGEFEEPLLRAELASHFATHHLGDTEWVEWWRGQVPEELLPNMAATVRLSESSLDERVVQLGQLAALGEVSGGAEWDALRLRMVQAIVTATRRGSADGPDHPDPVATALRIHDPGLRLRALESCARSGSIGRDWIRESLSEDEAGLLIAILERDDGYL